VKLPELEAWQKILFSEEVMPQYQRFVRDYRQSDAGLAGLKVEIDFDSLKNYLFFYAPKHLKLKSPSVLLIFKTDPSCQKCTESSTAIQNLVQARIVKRGFSPLLVNPTEIPSGSNVGAIEDQMTTLINKKNASGAILVQWKPAPVDDLDTAHADESRYVLRSFLQVKNVFLQSQPKELLDSDNFEVAEARILTDLFIDLGMKFAPVESVIAETSGDEILLEVTGIKDFAQYTRVKAQILNLLKESSSFVEDREFSKGLVVLAVYTKKNSDEIKKQITQIALDPSMDSTVKVGIR
jgi:hypothetical protein